jgi:hypothetical protein
VPAVNAARRERSGVLAILALLAGGLALSYALTGKIFREE